MSLLPMQFPTYKPPLIEVAVVDHEHNGIKSDQIEYGVLLCMDCHTERHHGKKCNDIKEYCRKYLIKLYGESIYSK